jgi:hypothetical protein
LPAMYASRCIGGLKIPSIVFYIIVVIVIVIVIFAYGYFIRKSGRPTSSSASSPRTPRSRTWTGGR